jgi:hypothetical protein
VRNKQSDYERSETPLDDGVVFIGRDDVEKVKIDSFADFLIDNAIEAYNERRRHGGPKRTRHYSSPYEVRTPRSTNLNKAILWLAKPVIGKLYLEVAQVNAGIASHTDRGTAVAQKRLQKNHDMGEFGFAFFIEPKNPAQSQVSKIESLRECIADLAIPSMNILVVSEFVHDIDPSDEMSLQELALEGGLVIPPTEILEPSPS